MTKTRTYTKTTSIDGASLDRNHDVYPVLDTVETGYTFDELVHDDVEAGMVGRWLITVEFTADDSGDLDA